MKHNRTSKKLDRPTRCPYCGAPVQIRPASEIYGDSSLTGKMYVCGRYHVCELMAKMTSVGKVEDWISVNDPACGAGGLLIAYANECRSQHVNYQTSVLFVGQDIDPVVGLMCYIQLSLLGCPGYVVIDDSIKNPIQSYDSKGLLPVMSERVWLTPVFFHSIWIYRRMVARLKLGDHKPQGEVPEVKA